MEYGTFLRLAAPSEADEGFAALRADGFDCCHLVYKPPVYTKADAEQITAAAKKHGVRIAALFAGYRDNKTKWNLSTDFNDAGINSLAYGEERIAYLKQAAVFCRDLGVHDMLIHAGFVANNPYSEEYQYMCGKMRDLALYLQTLSLDLLLETGGESPVTHLRLIRDTGCTNIFANLDTANLIMYGFGNPVDAVCTLAHHIRSVHVKDGTPPTDPDTLGKETEFGEGYVDFNRVFSGLRRIGFNGPLIIEREIPDGKRREKIGETLKHLKSVFEN